MPFKNYPLSDEESELLQEYGGHEPHVVDVLLTALRKERGPISWQSLLEAEMEAYQQRVRAFLAEYADGSD